MPGPGPWLLTAAETSTDDLAAAVTSSVELEGPRARAALLGRGRSRSSAQALLVERLARLEELDRYTRSERARKDIATEMRAAVAASPGSQVLAAVAGWIVPGYAVTDGLARRCQSRLKRLNIAVYAAAAVAVALGALAAIMFPYGGYWRLLVIFEAAVLAGLLAIQGLDLRRRCRDRWVAFRAMSEYFRIGRYLALVTPRTAAGLEFQHFARLPPAVGQDLPVGDTAHVVRDPADRDTACPAGLRPGIPRILRRRTPPDPGHAGGPGHSSDQRGGRTQRIRGGSSGTVFIAPGSAGWPWNSERSGTGSPAPPR